MRIVQFLASVEPSLNIRAVSIGVWAAATARRTD
jgi:hypothetical protein